MFCQKCGFELGQVEFCGSLWFAFYRCSRCRQGRLQVADARWIFPLLFLELQVLEKAVAASDEELKAAAKIEFINYKTVSIMEMEKILLG